MSEPASWQLVEFIRDTLKGVLVANGYLTDLGAGLFVLDDADIREDDGDAPAVVIEVTNVPVNSSTRGKVDSDANVTIEYGIPRGTVDNPKLLSHRARADIVSALMVDAKTLPKFIRTFELVDAQLFSANDASGASFVIAQVSARAGLTELKSPAP